MKLFLFLFILIGVNAFGFIPPITAILREIYDSRKILDGTEIVFNHQVVTVEGNWAEIEEKIYIDKKGLRFLWKPAPSNTVISGWLDKRTYVLGNDKKIGSRSLLFLKNFTSSSAVEFRDGLINERFLKWDQLKQFKDGFELQGEPQTWDIKNNYLEHDSISLVLLATGPSIAVIGFSEVNNKRIAYFDKALQGLSKLEWVDGSSNLNWNFEGFSVSLKESLFPKRAVFQKDGREIIQSELIAVRPLNKRQAAEWLQIWQKANKVAVNNLQSEDVIKNLLSER